MSQSEYFKFAETLARDLNGGEIKLPSFPDVVMRVRAALDDPDTTGRDLATVLGVDAVLAARVLILANSTYYNPGGFKIEGIEAAIGRVGFEKVRTAAIAYAVEQLHASDDLKPLKNELKQTWSAGLRLAAMSEVIAAQCSELDADSAFIAGLLNRIGILYIFTKYNEFPTLLQDAEARQNLIDQWVAPIGASIVENWKFPDEIQETLNPDEVETTRRRSTSNLADVVTTAKLSLSDESCQLQDTDEAKRLQLTEDKIPVIMESYKLKLESLRSVVR